MKPGHTRFYVGYKKHSLQLWLNSYRWTVRLIPLVSWLTPADVPEGYLLKPSLHYCWRRFAWRPDIVVGDLGYIHGQTKREIRQTWKVAVVTKMKANMSIIAPFESTRCVTCPQGQPLQWLEYNEQEDRHCFGVRTSDPLCGQCWQVSNCSREFEYPPGHHETLLGLIPLSTLPAQQLLRQARSWIEPTQSFEKNVLGLKSHFLNSLRLAWYLGLMADAAVLLRNLALFKEARSTTCLKDLVPKQRVLTWVCKLRQKWCDIHSDSIKPRSHLYNFVTPSYGIVSSSPGLRACELPWVTPVEILSQKGGRCIVQNPWPDSEATVYRNGKAAEGLSGKLLTFSTTAGERVALVPKGKAPTAKTLR